jgi:hypothetical protein
MPSWMLESSSFTRSLRRSLLPLLLRTKDFLRTMNRFTSGTQAFACRKSLPEQLGVIHSNQRPSSLDLKSKLYRGLSH